MLLIDKDGLGIAARVSDIVDVELELGYALTVYLHDQKGHTLEMGSQKAALKLMRKIDKAMRKEERRESK